MKNYPIITLLALTFFLAPVYAAETGGDENRQSDGFTIDEVLSSIQSALQIAANETEKGDLPELKLATVTVTLQTTFARKGGPKFKILVFSFGATWTKEKSQQTIVTLTPPTPKQTDHLPMQGGDITDNLAEAIISAAQGVKDAENREPPLVLKTLQVDMSFVVMSSTSAGVGFTIVPITAEFSGELSRKALHS